MCSAGAGSPDDASLKSWTCGPACDAVPGMEQVFVVRSDGDALAFGGRLHGECVIAFRGTSDVTGWMEDFAALKEPLQSQLQKAGCAKDDPLAVTGHSLG